MRNTMVRCIIIALLCCLTGLLLADEAKFRVGISDEKSQATQLAKKLESRFIIADPEMIVEAIKNREQLSNLCDFYVTLNTMNQNIITVFDVANDLPLVRTFWRDEDDAAVIIGTAADRYRHGNPLPVQARNKDPHLDFGGIVHYLHSVLKKDPRILCLDEISSLIRIRKRKNPEGYKFMADALTLSVSYSESLDEKKYDAFISVEDCNGLAIGSFIIRDILIRRTGNKMTQADRKRIEAIGEINRKKIEENAGPLIEFLMQVHANRKASMNSESERIFEEYNLRIQQFGSSDEALRILQKAIALAPNNVTYRYAELKRLAYRMHTLRPPEHLRKVNELLEYAIKFAHDFPDFNKPVFDREMFFDSGWRFIENEKSDEPGYMAFYKIWRPLYLKELLRLKHNNFDPEAKSSTYNNVNKYYRYLTDVYIRGDDHDREKWLTEYNAAAVELLKRVNDLPGKEALPKIKITFLYEFNPINTVAWLVNQEKEKILAAYINNLDEYLQLARESSVPQVQEYVRELEWMQEIINAPRSFNAVKVIMDEYQEKGAKASKNILTLALFLLKADERELFRKHFQPNETPKIKPKVNSESAPKSLHPVNRISYTFRKPTISPEQEAYFRQKNPSFDIEFRSYQDIFRHPSPLVKIDAVLHKDHTILALRTMEQRPNVLSDTYLGIVGPGFANVALIAVPFKTPSKSRVNLAVSGDAIVLAQREILAVYDRKNNTWKQFDDFILNTPRNLAVFSNRVFVSESTRSTRTLKSMKTDGTDRLVHYNNLRISNQEGFDEYVEGLGEFQVFNDSELLLTGLASEIRGRLYRYDPGSNQFRLFVEIPTTQTMKGIFSHRDNLYMAVMYTNQIRVYRINIEKRSIEMTLGSHYAETPALKIDMLLDSPCLVTGDSLWEFKRLVFVDLNNPGEKKYIYLPRDEQASAFILEDDSVIYTSSLYLFHVKRK